MQVVLGKVVRRPAKLDRQLARDLKALAHRDDPYDTVIGKTMCSNDFYEGQGRLDGAFCEFTETDKMEYLTKLQKAGVVNIEMESICFAALTHHAGIQSAVVCVTLLDRLKGDQVYLIYVFLRHQDITVSQGTRYMAIWVSCARRKQRDHQDISAFTFTKFVKIFMTCSISLLSMKWLKKNDKISQLPYEASRFIFKPISSYICHK